MRAGLQLLVRVNEGQAKGGGCPVGGGEGDGGPGRNHRRRVITLGRREQTSIDAAAIDSQSSTTHNGKGNVAKSCLTKRVIYLEYYTIDFEGEYRILLSLKLSSTGLLLLLQNVQCDTLKNIQLNSERITTIQTSC